jgi:hypothetical protein
MARLFTVPFLYQGHTYTAVVSMTQCNGISEVTIHLPDASLHPILGGTTVSFDAQKGLAVDYPNFTPAQELLVGILSAIEHYEEKRKEVASKQGSI